ncbi:MAG: metallophosphoesterase [Bacteroidaceae bacterium]|nr:metallophosphoesterase [Bacteroidaceae bacterium]
MKHLILSVAVSLCLLPIHADIRIAVISDCHITSDTEVLQAALDSIKTDKPDLLLISGDLTYNGEKQGHLAMSDLLHNFSAAGTRVLVVPGNHDILNPHHSGDEATTADDFSTIYAGFMGDIRYEGSLSWAQRIGKDMAIIGLDANIYGTGQYVSDGCITRSHLQWLAHTAQTLRSEGRMIIALVHQQLLEHFNNQASLFPSTLYNIRYQKKDNEDPVVTPTELRQAFADAGIHYVISGHFHVHDIAATDFIVNGKTWRIWDIGTGALNTYPHYFRTLQVDPETQRANITSKTVNLHSGYDMNLLKEQAQSLIKSRLTALLGETLATMALCIIGDDLCQALIAFTQGDEPHRGGAEIYERIRQNTDAVQAGFKDKLLKTLHSMMLDYNGTDETNVTPDATVVLQP